MCRNGREIIKVAICVRNEITTYMVVGASASLMRWLPWRECNGGMHALPQLFCTLMFSTFSAGSKGGGDFSDDGSRRVSHLFEVREKG